MQDFALDLLPSRVVFGVGTRAKALAEVDRLGHRSALVLSTPEQAGLAEEISRNLGAASVGIFSNATMHTPVAISEAAVARARALNADVVVGVGGGSTVGLAKAIALRTGLDQIVLPTTYAGSEMTPIVGETVDNLKTTRRSPDILPEVVIYDVELTLSLPPRLSATSGLNAIAHAVEALYAQDWNPIHALMAEEAVDVLGRALPQILRDPTDIAARSDALYGAWLCGSCLGAVGMALHHKLCHTLGGTFNLPHSETHSVVLPYALAYNAAAAPRAAAAVARALGTQDAIVGLYDLGRRLGAPASLRELGMPESGIERAADLAVSNPYWNPRPIERGAIRQLLARAWAGDPPEREN